MEGAQPWWSCEYEQRRNLVHERCGTVKAACSEEKVASPNRKAVVKGIRNPYITAGSAQDLRDIEKLNGVNSVQEIMNRSDTLRRLATADKFSKIGAYHHLDSGVVERL